MMPHTHSLTHSHAHSDEFQVAKCTCETSVLKTVQFGESWRCGLFAWARREVSMTLFISNGVQRSPHIQYASLSLRCEVEVFSDS